MTALTLITEGEVVEAVDAHALLYAAGIARLERASIEDLAATKEKLATLKSITGEADGILDGAIVARQDRDGCWTTHVGPYTIRSSSPTAGTVAYDVEKLRGVLADLVTAGVISAAGANGAVECVQPTAAVPYVLLHALRDAIANGLDQSEEETLADRLDDILAGEPEPEPKLKLAGVKALLKLPAVKAHVEACQVPADPGPRKAKVTRASSASRTITCGFVGWTKTSRRLPIPWYRCEDCGATFSEPHPTVMAPATDCKGRAA